MRRRRQKNTLLPKMIGVAVLVNATLLPILAHLGVFKSMKGQQRLIPVQIVQAPPPKPKAQAKKAHPKTAHHATAHHTAPPAAAREAHAPVGPQIHGLVAAGNGSGNGVTGIVPPGTSIAPPAPAPPPPAPTPPPSAATPPAPMPAPPTPAPSPPTPSPPAPHIPVLVQASVVHQVDPQIPSDFSDSDLPTTLRASFLIHSDGTAAVSLVKSTGSSTLDQLALAAARQWTFHPATEDGTPVQSYLRLTIQFVPSDSS